MKRDRSQTGTVAVIVAICGVMLFAAAALSIDLGNAFARKRDVQNQADMAALAGGAHLPNQAAARQAVADYLNKNQPQSDTGLACLADNSCVDEAQLRDGVEANGEVTFIGSTKLRVVTPLARVGYGLAKAVPGLGSHVDVRAAATVGVYTPGTVMPVYAVTGCDYGLQTITDPASGGPAPSVPTLASPTDTNATTLNSVSTSPAAVAKNASGVSLTLNAKDFSGTTKVGFFPEDGTAPVEQTSFGQTTPYTKAGNSNITLVIPDSVTAVEQVWYVRVFNAGSPGQWSKASEALPVRVGQAVLECESASSSGNYGTLRMPRNSPVANASWVPVNMAVGFEAPITMSIHTTPAADGRCTDGVNGAVESIQGSPKAGTNCVATDPGLTANDATQGLITGYSSSYPGRLVSDHSSTVAGLGCGAGGSANASPRVIPSTPRDYSINNDVLSCFLTDGGNLFEITRPSYSGGPKLSPAIYDSPRFFWQPVLRADPTGGASDRYSIVDYRPAFLTDESVATSTTRGTHTASADNGLTYTSSGLTQMKVIFFNADALPADSSGSVRTPYIGTGPAIVNLAD